MKFRWWFKWLFPQKHSIKYQPPSNWWYSIYMGGIELIVITWKTWLWFQWLYSYTEKAKPIENKKSMHLNLTNKNNVL